ncbi:MAG TPA: ACP phosphodiesterase [Cytophagales bacterium]|nr:ACP phosphodiesterase [Cytophagales bacterium]
MKNAVNQQKLESLNFLAHILLSDHSPEVMIGNFIADFIKGNHYQHLPEGVIKGIKLHRAIDDFTDTHDIVKKDIKIFQPYHSRYAGIVVDIIYDHILLKNWSLYSELDSEGFIDEFYEIIERNIDIIPEELVEVFPRMKAHNWLINYGNSEGLSRTFEAMTRRIHNRVDLNNAVHVMKENYEEIEKDFNLFFPQLIEHVSHYRMLLN